MTLALGSIKIRRQQTDSSGSAVKEVTSIAVFLAGCVCGAVRGGTDIFVRY